MNNSDKKLRPPLPHFNNGQWWLCTLSHHGFWGRGFNFFSFFIFLSKIVENLTFMLSVKSNTESNHLGRQGISTVNKISLFGKPLFCPISCFEAMFIARSLHLFLASHVSYQQGPRTIPSNNFLLYSNENYVRIHSWTSLCDHFS